MSDNFNALVINQEGEKFSREIKTIEKSFLKHGDVLVKVDYSTLNFKDALILKNGARLVKEFPHIPGIDFSGTVVESKSEKFKEGDEIIQTGWRVGEIYFGGYSQFAKVNSNFLVKKVKSLSISLAATIILFSLFILSYTSFGGVTFFSGRPSILCILYFLLKIFFTIISIF